MAVVDDVTMPSFGLAAAAASVTRVISPDTGVSSAGSMRLVMTTPIASTIVRLVGPGTGGRYSLTFPSFRMRVCRPRTEVGLTVLAGTQPRHRARLCWQRFSSWRWSGRTPGLGFVGDPGEPPTQLDGGRQFALLLIGGGGRGGIGFRDDEHGGRIQPWHRSSRTRRRLNRPTSGGRHVGRGRRRSGLASHHPKPEAVRRRIGRSAVIRAIMSTAWCTRLRPLANDRAHHSKKAGDCVRAPA
jgi:hypothetical protein